jgi:hypothetical protein
VFLSSTTDEDILGSGSEKGAKEAAPVSRSTFIIAFVTFVSFRPPNMKEV